MIISIWSRPEIVTLSHYIVLCTYFCVCAPLSLSLSVSLSLSLSLSLLSQCGCDFLPVVVLPASALQRPLTPRAIEDMLEVGRTAQTIERGMKFCLQTLPKRAFDTSHARRPWHTHRHKINGVRLFISDGPKEWWFCRFTGMCWSRFSLVVFISERRNYTL